MNRNIVFFGTVAILIIAAASLLSLGNQGIGELIHAISHKTGLCAGENHAAGSAIAQKTGNTPCAPGSASCDAPGQAVATNELSPDEKKIVDYIANQIVAENRFRFEDEEIEQATGVSVGIINESRLQAAVMAELGRRKVNLDAIACAENCATFSACSVDGTLNGASEELARYQAEKAEDGKTYAGLAAPGFTLQMTDGNQISLAHLREKSVAMIFLSVHCYHSMQTLPILANLQKKYQSQGLVILPVFVNANSVQDIRDAIEGFDLGFPVGVAEGKAFSESYNSRMVPTMFLINGQGNIVKKLVGQKDETILDQALGELIEASMPAHRAS